MKTEKLKKKHFSKWKYKFSLKIELSTKRNEDNELYNTVKVYDFVPLPPVTVLGPTLPTVAVFCPTLRNVTSTLPTVTDRYRSLANFTVTNVTDRNIGCFEDIF